MVSISLLVWQLLYSGETEVLGTDSTHLPADGCAPAENGGLRGIHGMVALHGSKVRLATLPGNRLRVVLFLNGPVRNGKGRVNMRAMICLLVLSLLLAGCGSQEPSESTIQTAIAKTQEAQAPTSPQPRVQPAQDAPAPESPTGCDADHWQIIPLSMRQESEGGGWKTLVVQLAIANESSYWGYVDFGPDSSHVTTEGGYTYRGTGYRISFVAEGKARGFVPPGFTVGGFAWYDDPAFSFAYKVAESQDEFVLNVDYMTIMCFPYGQRHRESVRGRAIDLQNIGSIASFVPTWAEELPDFPAVLELPGQGQFEFQGVSRSVEDQRHDSVTLHLRFRNATGYDQRGERAAFLIGDDGRIARDGGLGMFSAGPGQESDANWT